MRAVSHWGTRLNLPRVRFKRCGGSKQAVLREKLAHKAEDNIWLVIESNNTKHRNNYFTWRRIMFWMMICASIRWDHLFSQISREWQLRCSTKVSVYASCKGCLFIVPWFSEQFRDKAIWFLSLSVLQSCLFQLLRCADHLLENLLLVWPVYC